MEAFSEFITYLLPFLFIIMAISFGVALVLLVWIVWQVKRIELPPEADFQTALLHTPFVVVLVLDLLDISLNFMSAPVGWAILTYLGLRPLRGITVVEGVLPGTELVPTMTVAWVAVRLMGKRL